MPMVFAALSAGGEAQKGDPFTVQGNVSTNQSGSYVLEITLPEGFQNGIRTRRDVRMTAGREYGVTFQAQAGDTVAAGRYDIAIEVLDNRGLQAAFNVTTIRVTEAMALRTPLGEVKVPKEVAAAIRLVQDRFFSIASNTFALIKSSAPILAGFLLCLSSLTYIYFRWSKRRRAV